MASAGSVETHPDNYYQGGFDHTVMMGRRVIPPASASLTKSREAVQNETETETQPKSETGTGSNNNSNKRKLVEGPTQTQNQNQKGKELYPEEDPAMPKPPPDLTLAPCDIAIIKHCGVASVILAVVIFCAQVMETPHITSQLISSVSGSFQLMSCIIVTGTGNRSELGFGIRSHVLIKFGEETEADG